MSYFKHIKQDAVVSTNNSSTTNLSAANNFTFTGTLDSTLGVAAIQVSLFTDQDCLIQVQQSPNEIPNWDIIDKYFYKANSTFGITVQAINSYFRVVVSTNNLATTVFRLQSVLCPIVEAIPRSLDFNGNLKTANPVDGYGFKIENTPHDEMRTITPIRLIGTTFSGMTTADSNFWTFTTANSGYVSVANNQATLNTSTSANGSIKFQTVRSARYIGGTGNRFRAQIRVPDLGVTNNIRRWGLFNNTDGAYFMLSGNQLALCTKKTNVETAVLTGSWNRLINLPIITNCNSYEIYFTNAKVYYTIAGELVHTASFPITTWTDNTTLPCRVENINSNNLASNVQLECRVATCYRMGELTTLVQSNFLSGQYTGKVLKFGAGNLHRIILSNVLNNSIITLYDNTASNGNVIFTTGIMNANSIPLNLDFHGIPFSNGLTASVTNANCNMLIIYE